MAKIKIGCLFLFIFLKPLFSYGQTIKGDIKDLNGLAVENASVSFWDSEKKQQLLGYTFTDIDGNYDFRFKEKTVSTYIEINSLGYAILNRLLEINDSPMRADFVLESKETVLKEINIVSERQPIRIKNDSTFYDPKKFLNGTESKVEDLLKKLPGITLNSDTGEIKFKGKSIETVQLEDDDLFGGNYVLGTKNISVDMVEQVQAIENYSSNKVLKGIEDSDKVVLNLKLKKNKTDFSGTLDLYNGYGNELLFADEATLLGISKKIKSFGVLKYNNVGLDVKKLTPSFENSNFNQLPSDGLFAGKNIDQSYKSNVLQDTRTRFNNTLFTNYNLVYKLSKRLRIKNTLVFYKDKNEASETYESRYFDTSSLSLNTSQENNYLNKENYFKADSKITFNASDNSLLIGDFTVLSNSSTSIGSTLQNTTEAYESKLKTKDVFLKAKAEYTIKLAERKAMQITSLFSKNEIPQEFEITPNNSFITGTDASKGYQHSKFDKQNFYNRATYLEARNGIKQTFSIGLLFSDQPFISYLRENDGYNVDFANDNSYKSRNLFWEYFSTFSFFKKKLEIQPYLASNYYVQALTDYNANDTLKHKDLVFDGNLQITYEFNKHSSVYLNGASQNRTPDEAYLFKNKVLRSNTAVKDNIPSLDLIKTESISFGYKYYDLFKQLTISTGIQYSIKSNAFLNNIKIDPNFTEFTFFQSPTTTSNKSLFFSIDKLIKFLNLSVSHTSLVSRSDYRNSINDFELRNNRYISYNGSLALISFFDFPINFENLFSYDFTGFISQHQHQSQNSSIRNNFKIIYIPIESLVISVGQDFYFPNVKAGDNFQFMDFNIKYSSPKLKWLSFNVSGKNLSNTNKFKQIFNTDYSYSIYQSNLIPRHFLISTQINF